MMHTRGFKVFIHLFLLTGGSAAAWAVPQDAHDVLVGNGQVGPFSLSWKEMTGGTDHVSVNATPMLPGIDYTLDPDAGTITFVRPVPVSTTVDVEYEYDSEHSVRNVAALAIPLSLSLAQTNHASLSMDALYQNSQDANSPGTLTFGVGGAWQGGDNSSLKTHFLFAPALSNADAETASDGIDRMGFSVAGATNAGRTTQLTFGFSRAGLGLGDAASANQLTAAGTQQMTFGGHFTPNQKVQATIAYTQTDPLTAAAGTETTQSSVGLVVTPNQKVQIKTDLGQSSVAGAGTTQTQDLLVGVTPNARTQVNASVAQSNAPGTASDTQTSQLTATNAPSKTVSMTAQATQSKVGDATTDQQVLNLSLTPRPILKVNTGVALTQTDQFATVATTVGTTFQPNPTLQVTGSQTFRSASAADQNLPDTLDSSSAQVTLSPIKALKVIGSYAQNPDQGVLSAPQHLTQRNVSLETSIGALSLQGGYQWLSTYDTTGVGTSLNFGVGLRLSRTLNVTGGCSFGQSGVDLTTEALATNSYSFGLTQNLGDRFNLSFNGTMAQQSGPAVTSSPDYTASANLGMKF